MSRSRIEFDDPDRRIFVTATAASPEENIRGYKYAVSGGRIVGGGREVVWVLDGAKSGTYTITVEVDGDCGLCSETKTETLVIGKP